MNVLRNVMNPVISQIERWIEVANKEDNHEAANAYRDCIHSMTSAIQDHEYMVIESAMLNVEECIRNDFSYSIDAAVSEARDAVTAAYEQVQEEVRDSLLDQLEHSYDWTEEMREELVDHSMERADEVVREMFNEEGLDV